jgi:hypothetical protein
MRIVSSFKDYYDCAIQHGQDDDIIYIRESKVVKEPAGSWERCGYDIRTERVYTYTICFCGQTFRFLAWRENYYYTYESIKKAFYEKGFDVDATNKGLSYRYYGFNVYKYYHPDQDTRKVMPWVERKEKRLSAREARGLKNREDSRRINRNEKPKTVYEMYNSPIILIGERGETTINPRLNKYQFQKVKDPFTTYQDLYIWFANQANPEKTIPQNLTDAEFATIKGFNKWSFRKEPTKRKV